MTDVPKTPKGAAAKSATAQSAEPAGGGAGERQPHELAWYERPSMVSTLVLALTALGIVLIGARLLLGAHSDFWFKALPGFYALIALASVIATTSLAKAVRTIFEIPEDHYDQ